MRVRKMMISLVLGLVGLYLVVCVLLYLFQDRMIFLPDRVIDTTPDKQGMDYEDVRIGVTPTESIHGWYFAGNQPPESAATVLVCHGNGGNVAYWADAARLLHDRVGEAQRPLV